MVETRDFQHYVIMQAYGKCNGKQQPIGLLDRNVRLTSYVYNCTCMFRFKFDIYVKRKNIFVLVLYHSHFSFFLMGIQRFVVLAQYVHWPKVVGSMQAYCHSFAKFIPRRSNINLIASPTNYCIHYFSAKKIHL